MHSRSSLCENHMIKWEVRILHCRPDPRSEMHIKFVLLGSVKWRGQSMQDNLKCIGSSKRPKAGIHSLHAEQGRHGSKIGQCPTELVIWQIPADSITKKWVTRSSTLMETDRWSLTSTWLCSTHGTGVCDSQRLQTSALRKSRRSSSEAVLR